MIKSMTGYGKAEIASDNGRLTVEIRSVNHRYGEVYIKLPRLLFPFENDLKKGISQRIKRGKIEVFIQYEPPAGTGIQLEPDFALARAYYEALDGIRASLEIHGPVPLSLVVSQKDVLVSRESSAVAGDLKEDLDAAVMSAVDNLDIMRLREGDALLRDLVERRAVVVGLIAQVAQRAPLVVSDYSQKLKERVRQLAGEVQVDEARLVQEIAIFADKSDITEELVRFTSHLQQLDDILQLDEPVGRKLDFLMQELNREVNTIGSKANDSDIASLVVQVKAELERIREQIQNIE